MRWDWGSTWFEAEPGNPAGGGMVYLGVSWFDRAFFDERRDAWFGRMQALTPARNAPIPARGHASTGPSGSLESRIAMSEPAAAISTQSALELL